MSIEFDDEQFEALREFVADHPHHAGLVASSRKKRHGWVLRADSVALLFLEQDITHALVHGDVGDDWELLESVTSAIEEGLGRGHSWSPLQRMLRGRTQPAEDGSDTSGILERRPPPHGSRIESENPSLESP